MKILNTEDALRRSRAHALLCAAVFFACLFVSHPFAEIALNDDWSYVRTAQLLAQTGHIHYNGWATAILGWQLLPAALMIRLAGFSFTAARIPMMLIGGAIAYLSHRVGVLSGLRSKSAVLASLTVCLSPLFLPLTATFMTDIAGLFAIVACLYCCLKALSTTDQKTALGWISSAAIIGSVCGTARQIAWLAPLVMVPSALFLLWERKLVRPFAAVVIPCASLVFVLGTMHWFHSQPYSLPEKVIPGRLTVGRGIHGVHSLLELLFEGTFLLLPVLLIFAPALLRLTRVRLAGFLLALAAILGLASQIAPKHAKSFLPPPYAFAGNVLSLQGLFPVWPVVGDRPVLLGLGIRIIFAVLSLLGLTGLVITLRQRTYAKSEDAGLGWRTLAILLLPFTCAYLVLLLPRAAFELFGVNLVDRYILPIMLLGCVVLLRTYQERVTPTEPLFAFLILAVFGAYSTIVTHDLFAMYEGVAKAAGRLEATGVPPDSIDGGWEFNSWNQVNLGGFVHDPRLHEPPQPREDRRVCTIPFALLLREVKPIYSFAFSRDACQGATSYPATTFTTWMPWRTTQVFVVKNAPL